jgi:hypothetical protein
MEPSRSQHHLLAILLLVLVSGARIAGAAEPRCEAPPLDPCDSQYLASVIGGSCPANLYQSPTENCCMGVVAAVGIRFGDTVQVPCLCLVAKERYLAIMGLDIYSILRLYPICHGIRAVGPETAESCRGRV